VLAGLAVMGLLLASLVPSGSSQSSPATTAQDRVMRLISEARKAFAGVQDYTFTLVKREQVNGQLLPENVIAVKIRNQPFSIHMRWLKPKPQEGQEACYVAGKNNGMMRVKPAGMLGAMGFVNIDPKDPRVRQMSRHSITDAGIGNLIERCAQRWEADRQTGKTKLRIGEYEFDGRKCMRVEASHPGSKPGDFYAYRIVVYFDKEMHLPLRCEMYDWPKEGGKAEGEQVECFSFTDLKLNVGLTDESFNY
jgi:outer membrane lipoprotein-sorting protein